MFHTFIIVNVFKSFNCFSHFYLCDYHNGRYHFCVTRTKHKLRPGLQLQHTKAWERRRWNESFSFCVNTFSLKWNYKPIKFIFHVIVRFETSWTCYVCVLYMCNGHSDCSWILYEMGWGKGIISYLYIFNYSGIFSKNLW